MNYIENPVFGTIKKMKRFQKIFGTAFFIQIKGQPILYLGNRKVASVLTDQP
jgi:hypothetical protein